MNVIRKIKIIPREKIWLSSSTIFEGDTLRVLDILPSESIQCAITSPPYWGLRDYDIDGQIGLESTLPEYINRLVAAFREVRRVLKPDGLFWLNIGDGYTSGNRKWRAPDKKNRARAMKVRPDTPDGLKPKDLLGVPWRLALALQEDGWFLRSDIIWNKPNAMPESVKDRPNRCHEYLFMFSKSERYYYDYEASKEGGIFGIRNRRSVWSINTQPFPEAHFATFPAVLIEPCVQISTKPGDFILDPFFGSGTVGVVCQDSDRKFLGIELNPEYIKIAYNRLRSNLTNIYRLAS
jgi:site-specific DNA-methyltransferase (adenine-specific)